MFFFIPLNDRIGFSKSFVESFKNKNIKIICRRFMWFSSDEWWCLIFSINEHYVFFDFFRSLHMSFCLLVTGKLLDSTLVTTMVFNPSSIWLEDARPLQRNQVKSLGVRLLENSYSSCKSPCWNLTRYDYNKYTHFPFSFLFSFKKKKKIKMLHFFSLCCHLTRL